MRKVWRGEEHNEFSVRALVCRERSRGARDYTVGRVTFVYASNF